MIGNGGEPPRRAVTMPFPDQDFRGESDEDLLVYMSLLPDDPDVARAACEEFYNRHSRYILAVIGRAHREMLGDQTVEDLVMETFRRVYEKAHTYKACGAMDANGARRNVLAWVGAIAHNACADHYRHPDSGLQLVDDWEPVETLIVPTKVAGLSPNLQLVHEALATLSDRDRTVLLVTMQYYDPTRPHQRLPNEVAADLAKSFDTTQENIRKVRERALARLRKQIETAKQKDPVRSEP
jgi:RNA polymerase sigma factor (sigma-70 family)